VLALGILLMIFSFMVIADPIFGSKTIVLFTSLAIITYGVSYIIFGIQLKKVKDIAGDIKQSVVDNLDSLKNQVLTLIEDSKENQPTTEDIRKKFDSFKDSIS
jgi:hypothetical protein